MRTAGAHSANWNRARRPVASRMSSVVASIDMEMRSDMRVVSARACSWGLPTLATHPLGETMKHTS